MAKKKSGQKKEKMSLQEFLQDTGSNAAWGDRDDDEFIAGEPATAPVADAVLAGAITTEDIRAEQDARPHNRRVAGTSSGGSGMRFEANREQQSSDLADTWRTARTSAPSRAPVQDTYRPSERPKLEPIRPSSSMAETGGMRTQLERMSDREAPTEGPFVCFIANLPFNATIDDVGNFFDSMGPCKVDDVVLRTDRETGRPKGIGYVIFKDVESLKTAVENMHGMDFMGRPIRVDYTDAEVARKIAFPQESKSWIDNFKSRPPRDGMMSRFSGPKTEADEVDVWRRGERVVEKQSARFQSFGGKRRDERRHDRQPRNGDSRAAEKKPEKPSPFGEGKAWDNTDIDKQLEERLQLEKERIRKLVEEEEKRQQESKDKKPTGRWGGESGSAFGRKKKFGFGKDREGGDQARGGRGGRGRGQGNREAAKTVDASEPSPAPAKQEDANIYDALGDVDAE